MQVPVPVVFRPKDGVEPSDITAAFRIGRAVLSATETRWLSEETPEWCFETDGHYTHPTDLWEIEILHTSGRCHRPLHRPLNPFSATWFMFKRTAYRMVVASFGVEGFCGPVESQQFRGDKHRLVRHRTALDPQMVLARLCRSCRTDKKQRRETCHHNTSLYELLLN